MTGVGTLPWGGYGGYGKGRLNGRLPATTRQPHRRLSAALSVIASVALIAAILGLIFLFYDQSNQATPPPGPASPTSVPAPTTTQSTGWLTYGGNPARTRNVPGPALAGEPVLLWTADVGISSSPAAGVLVDGAVYWPSDRGLAALDAASGQRLWLNSEVTGNAEIDGDGLIVPSALRTGTGYDLVRIKRSDGSVVWRIEPGLIPDQGVIAVVDGVGYTQSGQELIAFDPASGEVLWRAPHETMGLAWLAVAEGVVAAGGQTSDLMLYTANGGDPLWTYHTNEGSVGPPTIANGMVYFRTMDAGELAFYAVDLATGELRWRVPSPSGRFSNPAISETTVYAMNGDGNLYAVDALTGEIRWTHQIGPGNYPSVVLAGDVIFVAGPDGFLYAVDAANGTERWRFALDAPAATGAIVVGGVAYVQTGSGTLYAVGGSESLPDGVPAAVASPAAISAATPTPTPVAESGAAEFLWTIPRDPSEVRIGGAPGLDPSGRIWIPDVTTKQFRIYDLDGNYLESWGSHGTGDGQLDFTAIWGIFFAPDGSFYVLDNGNHRIQKFGPDRAFLLAWGSRGTGDGQFLEPACIAIAPDGTLYITDHLRVDVQAFDANGNFLGKFGEPGSGDGQFLDGPPSLAIGADGTLYVPDNGNHRVQVFDPEGRYLRQFGTRGDGEGELYQPFWIDLDETGNIYVADVSNQRIQVFAPDGSYLAEWGTPGSGPGKFIEPYIVIVGRGGIAYVLDGANGFAKFRLLPPLAP